MITIANRRRAIEKRERKEREVLLKKHHERFSAERAALQADCAKEGHQRGNFWDNGLGFTWYYCAKCGARMDDQKYDMAGEA